MERKKKKYISCFFYGVKKHRDFFCCQSKRSLKRDLGIFCF